MSGTRSGEQTSMQTANFGAMDLSAANFKIEGDVRFNIKNEGDAAVTLEVIPGDSKTGAFVATKFDPGWNPEIVREVKKNTAEGLALKWGY